MNLTVGTSGAEDAHELAHVGFGVDAAGRRDRVSVGSLVRQYRYDSRGRRDGDRVLTLGSESSRGSSVVAGREYTWRADSVVTGISDLLAGPIGLDVDELGRVTGVARRVSSDPVTGSYLDPWTATAGPDGQTSGAQAVREFYSFTTAGVLDRVDPGADFRDTNPTSGGGSSPTGSGAAARGKPENLARLADLTAGEHTAEAVSGSASEAVVGVDLDGTLVTRVGRTRLHYDACGRVVRTVSKRLSRKPLVREFTYGATGQVRGFSCSDEPEYRWVYVYDGLARRVAKEKIHTGSGEVVHRVVFLHDGDRIVGEHTTVDSPHHHPGQAADHRGSRVNDGRVWVTDPATGELLGQVTLGGSNSLAAAAATGPAPGRWSGPAGVAGAPQHAVDAMFHVMVTDLTSDPRELINPDTGDIAGRVEQSLYGRRTWHGEVFCPLLFAGQYEDGESGWVYNRFRNEPSRFCCRLPIR